MKLAVAPRIAVGGGLFTAKQWRAIGDALGEEAKVEFTTFKQLYVEVEEGRTGEVKEALEAEGLEVYEAGFFAKNVIACNFCKGAEEAGLSVALRINSLVAGLPVPSPLKVGYAGCVNATSEPLFKDIGVVKTSRGFDIYLGGDGKTTKAAVGQLWLAGAEEEKVPEIVGALIECYREHGKKKERFSRFVARMTPERLKELAGIPLDR